MPILSINCPPVPNFCKLYILPLYNPVGLNVTTSNPNPNQFPITNNVTNAAVLPLNASATDIDDASSSDPDGTVVAYRIITLPTNGTLYKQVGLSLIAMAANEAIVAADFAVLKYQPGSNYGGNDVFTYAAIDDDGAEDQTPANFIITVFVVSPSSDAGIATCWISVEHLTYPALSTPFSCSTFEFAYLVCMYVCMYVCINECMYSCNHYECIDIKYRINTMMLDIQANLDALGESMVISQHTYIHTYNHRYYAKCMYGITGRVEQFIERVRPAENLISIHI